ncbi:DoxX family protein [Mobiluncus curtisii]|uniref:DoxX family protein n=1 Tax=Mobiluncus curtisii ATCC 51333 TaxID=887326 RepID=E6M0Y2_9ACTO|nr:DoxX family protein [Mobiluncus curtisii ATCC 51333]
MQTVLKNGDNSVMRTLLRFISRPLLAAVFIHDGLDALLNPDDHVERFRKMEPTLEKVGLPPILTSDAKLLSRLAGAATAVTALGLALGKSPRICALILAVVNLPISVVNNPVWAAKSTAERRDYTRGLVAGGSLAGGLGMVLADGNGQPSLKARREIARAAKAGK